MIDFSRFLGILAENNVSYFTGVPDSYLNGFCNHLLTLPEGQNVIAANEGNAVAIGCGHYFATGKSPLVYMQNSGMGNALNPLASLADRHVYRVPMVLLIGWRGQPGTGDHAQHETQGEITPGLLDVMHIPYVIAADDDSDFEAQLRPLLAQMNGERIPVAVIAPKGVFAAAEKKNVVDDSYPMSREDAIEILMNELPADTIFCATTGRATREIYWLRERRGESHDHDYLNVGSMGHCSSVALGIALAKPGRRVVVLDGDSAAIMHLGCFTMLSKMKAPNLLHVVLNNGAHESVGGQPSAGHLVNFTAIAEASGYQTAGKPAVDESTLRDAIRALEKTENAAFIDCRIHKGLKGKLPMLRIESHEELIAGLERELHGDAQ